MNRQIKFRFWNKIAEVMDYPKEEAVILVPTRYREANGIELMQYTGLLDKNGKEIYEGDICEWPSGINREIVWDSRNACFSSRDVMLMAEIGKIAILGHHLEIIGNIYENPELIPLS